MDKFLETHNLRLNQGEIKNLNRPITSNEIESVLKKCPAESEVQNQMALQMSSTKHLKK